MLKFPTVSMSDGKLFDGNKIGELTEAIISKLTEEKLTCAEAKIVLNKVVEVIDEFSTVRISDSTASLVDELSMREGVEMAEALPYETKEIKIEGPAKILIITD